MRDTFLATRVAIRAPVVGMVLHEVPRPGDE